MRLHPHTFFAALALAFLLAGAAVAQTTQAAAMVPPDDSGDYQIGPRDLIAITVFQDKDLNTEARVGNDGKINLPLLGAVDVSGLTTNEAAARIKAFLESQYMNKADVAVSIEEYNSRPISVFGAVNKPGKISANGNMTLIQAISAAGGLSGSAPAQSIYVLRTAKNSLTGQLVVDADELMVKGNPDLNIPLMPNDVVNVLPDKTINIYLLGEVSRPGFVQFRESQNPTLLQALAAAGGLTDRANRGAIIVKRKTEGKETMSRVNLRAVLAGNTPDYPLKDNDTIIINESFF